MTERPRPSKPSSAAPSADQTRQLAELKAQLKQCQLQDRYKLRRTLTELSQRFSQGRLERLQERVERSQAQVAARQQLPLTFNYDDNLPIAARRDEITKAIANHQVVVIAGETGSGKTTQLPKMCLELGRGEFGLIGHTQPRRLAARAVATRLAEELETELGAGVGYQVRFNDQVSDASRVKVMTDGILLAEIQHDRYLNRYDTLIIDEAHERSLNIDFLLGYLKHILAKRPELKLIITSATIDVERFSRHFANAPVIEVSGRTYPVEVRYRPLEDLERDNDDDALCQGIAEALSEISDLERRGQAPRFGDVLVFLSGEREIREVAHFLRDQKLRDTEVLPLYARLSASEQSRIFQSHTGRRVILSTNVAETSLTVPGIVYVIDSGVARISRYSVRSKVQRLPIEPISQASANQRKGRCGRVTEGICFRLYGEADFLSRPEFTDAEILRTNLAAVILQMLKLGLGDISRFPFLDRPQDKAINDGFKLLHELGAVNRQHKITGIGRQLARLPVDPRLGRMLLAAGKERALAEVLVIASALSIQDPRERPAEKRQAADQRHREHYDDHSDFIGFLNLWQQYEKERQELSQNQLRKYCKKQFLSFMRMREWRDMHRQLLLSCKDLGLEVNQEEANHNAIHRALLAGLLSHLGHRHDDKEQDYLGARNRKFFIFPGSTLYKRKPKWVMSAELVETSKLYARTTAKIDPAWIEPLAQHLIKRNWFEPHWEQKRAQVIAYEQVTLYGLIVVAKRAVHYGPVDPVVAREIFIRSALVEGQFRTRAPFFQHNRQLLEDVDQLEAKSRRRDILVDPETLYTFYDEMIPAGIYNGAGFEKWRKEAEQKEPKLLFLTREYLMRHEAEHITAERFPDTFKQDGLNLPLSYRFEPGQKDDGVSIQVPVSILQQLPRYRFDWLVPGMLEEKCVALMRSLPKQLRRHFVPVPDYAKAALEGLSADDMALHEALGERLFRITRARIPLDSWNLTSLDAHHLMNFQVRDANGKLLGQGRDLVALKEQFADQAQAGIQDLGDYSLEREGITRWDFGALPDVLEQQRAGLTLRLYPALVDHGQEVQLKLFEHEAQARHTHAQGLARLVMLSLPAQFSDVKKRLKRFKQTALLAVTAVNKKKLEDQLLLLIARTCFFPQGEPLPVDADGFTALCDQHRSQLVSTAETLDELLFTIFESYNRIGKRLKGKISFEWALSLADLKQQLNTLIHPDFLLELDLARLQEYPRYLKGMEQRLEKLGQNLAKDRVHCDELAGLWDNYRHRLEALQRHGVYDQNLADYRWLLEEYRISLFAQTLGTRAPVSAKRLAKLWALVATV